jgi:ribonuclease J
MENTNPGLRIIPLGGLEEIGRNMMYLEYGSDIVIIDMGVMWPEEDMPGIDYIIPNIDSLREKSRNIRGVIISHGHLDHTGAIPHLMAELGNPPIYTAALTKAMILKRMDDFPKAPKLKIQVVKPFDKLNLGNFKIKFLPIDHTIPDSLSTILETPEGSILHTSDFRFQAGDTEQRNALEAEGKKGVLALLSDSTGVENKGRSISEETVVENLDKIFQESEGRIIAATFSSLLTRIQELLKLAEKHNRKVALEGYSMRSNVEIAQKLGYLKVNKGTFIKTKDIYNYPDKRILVLGTGAQGESNAFMMRLVTGEHRHMKLKKGDSIIFSSSVIPGNERSIQGLKDSLFRSGAKVYHYQMMDIHASGHGYQEDLKEMIKLVNPKYHVPVHGYHFMLRLHAQLAESIGIPAENTIVLDNGDILEFKDKKFKILDKKVPAGYVMVDGLGVGDVGNVVLRDRQMMAGDGMFVIMAMIDSRTGKMQRRAQIISRGFIYMKESQGLIDDTRKKIKDIVDRCSGAKGTTNWTYVQQQIRNDIGEFLYQKTQRRPLILPMIVEI